MSDTSRLRAVFISCFLAASLAAAPTSAQIPCGGIAGGSCPDGTTCVDIPGDGCSPSCGGADCAGFCAEVPPVILCGGIAGLQCPSGLTCIDSPSDKCVPDCGGADCPGVCVFSEGAPCAGFAGIQCPAGFECVDASGDNCNPGCGGADCGGICVREQAPFCGGIASFPCPTGLVCVDDPGDSCDNDCSGADCSGICVDPVGACPDGSVPGSGIDIRWPAGQFMVWDAMACAETYNAYRLTAQRLEDADGDGAADYYGACLQPDLFVPMAPAPQNPPASMAHFFLITAENPMGEGSMGQSSQQQLRQNLTPCP